MSLRYPSFRESLLHGDREREETERVGDILATLPHFLRDIYVLETEFLCKAFERMRAVHRIEVLALEILDDSKLELHPVALFPVPDYDRNLRETSNLGGTQSALARDELILAPYTSPLFLIFAASDHKRLQYPVLAYGIGEILELRLIKLSARLEWVRFYALYLYPEDGVVMK